MPSKNSLHLTDIGHVLPIYVIKVKTFGGIQIFVLHTVSSIIGIKIDERLLDSISLR